jgi:molecular chaperone DnaJ
VENFKGKDYYQVLGVNPKVTQKEIKAAYRALARKYHPDVNPGNKLSESKFKEIGEAYSILVDENKRRQYDIIKGIQRDPVPNQSQSARKQADTAYSKQKETNQKATPEEDQKTFNDVFSDFFNGVFKKDNETVSKTKKQTEQAANPKRGDDITADISVSVIEAHNGTVRKVNVLHTDTCGQCKGKRYVNGAPCIICGGQGEVTTHKAINVKIPPNVKEGAKIRISNEGNKGQMGGENGDLFLLVHIQKHSLFTFENINVLCEIPITPSEAALGTEINVPTIDGHISMKIPPETQSGQKFRLIGQGILDAQLNKKGDQFVTVNIEIPKNLSEKEKQLYQELARIRKFNPRENIVYEK